MSLLLPDSGLLFWMLLSFGVVFVVLAKYGFPVIRCVEETGFGLAGPYAFCRRLSADTGNGNGCHAGADYPVSYTHLRWHFLYLIIIYCG